MPTMEEAASAFLANKRIAVTGVSRKPKEHGANTVYKCPRDRRYEEFAVNPNAREVEGHPQLSRLEDHPRRRRRCGDRRPRPKKPRA